jgi:hypothetical protein
MKRNLLLTTAIAIALTGCTGNIRTSMPNGMGGYQSRTIPIGGTANSGYPNRYGNQPPFGSIVNAVMGNGANGYQEVLSSVATLSNGGNGITQYSDELMQNRTNAVIARLQAKATTFNPKLGVSGRGLACYNVAPTFVDGIFACKLGNGRLVLVDEEVTMTKLEWQSWYWIGGNQVDQATQDALSRKAAAAWIETKPVFSTVYGSGTAHYMLLEMAEPHSTAKRYLDAFKAISGRLDVTLYTTVNSTANPQNALNVACSPNPAQELDKLQSGGRSSGYTCPGRTVSGYADFVVFSFLMNHREFAHTQVLMRADGKLIDLASVATASNTQQAAQRLLDIVNTNAVTNKHYF